MRGDEPAARWEEIDAVLSAALERPSQERLRFVRERTLGDPKLAAAVEDLLAAGDAASLFLERPIDVDADELRGMMDEMLSHWRQRVQEAPDPRTGRAPSSESFEQGRPSA